MIKEEKPIQSGQILCDRIPAHRVIVVCDNVFEQRGIRYGRRFVSGERSEEKQDLCGIVFGSVVEIVFNKLIFLLEIMLNLCYNSGTKRKENDK